MELRASDGYEGYRNKETEALSDLIQGRIHELQNPKDCDTARKLVCTLNKGSWIIWIMFGLRITIEFFKDINW